MIIKFFILFVIVIILLVLINNKEKFYINKEKKKNYKIIVVTPAGRQHYLKILLKQLTKQKNDFYEWHLWENTRHDQDKKYIENLDKKYKWIKCIKRNIPKHLKGKAVGINYFWDYVTDKNIIYIRLDDDVVWLENNFIKNLSNFRLNNPQYSFVYANIVNNNIIDHIHQRIGALNINENINYLCMGNSWNSKKIPIEIHKQFMESIKKNELSKWKFSKWILNYYERVSINSLCWIGGELNIYNLLDYSDYESEEKVVSEIYPKNNNKPAIICGNALCAHGAFYTQRTPELEELLQEYNNL